MTFPRSWSKKTASIQGLNLFFLCTSHLSILSPLTLEHWVRTMSVSSHRPSGTAGHSSDLLLSWKPSLCSWSSWNTVIQLATWFTPIYPSDLSLENSSFRKPALTPMSKFAAISLWSQGIQHFVFFYPLPLRECNRSLSPSYSLPLFLCFFLPLSYLKRRILSCQ